MRFLFLHGPGFNSFAERVVLGPLFKATRHHIHFWNEPSRLRPEGDRFHARGAFAHWLASAERALLACAGGGPVSLIAHSVSVVAAMELARRHPTHLSSLVLVTPTADPFAGFRSVLRLAQQCAAAEGLDIAARLKQCTERTREVFDDPMREGFELVLEHALLGPLITRYWVDHDRFRSALAAQARPEAQFDVESFFAVLEDLRERWPAFESAHAVTTPTLVMFADRDPVTPAAEQIEAIRANIPDATIETVEQCGHFIHLERPQQFFDRVLHWAGLATSQ